MDTLDNNCPVPKLTVLGLGNILSGDDGIGVLLVQKLAEQSQRFSCAEFVDAGVAGLRLLNLLEEVPAVLIVDSANMNLAPGESRLILPANISANQDEKGFSLHDISFAQTLAMAERFFSRPAAVIFGIQPKTIEQSSELSSELQHAFDELFARLTELLDNWQHNSGAFRKILLEPDICKRDKMLLQCLAPEICSN